MMRAPATLLAAAITAATLTPAHAAVRHGRRHRAAQAAPLPTEATAAPQPFMFYPQNVEGGVAGNLPFNNQIRKHTDPLNANGGH